LVYDIGYDHPQILHTSAKEKVNMRASEFITEGGGYIPQTEEEAHDPRFMMAITCDIHPGEDVKQAAKLNFKLGKGGRPPMLRSDGKITESPDFGYSSFNDREKDLSNLTFKIKDDRNEVVALFNGVEIGGVGFECVSSFDRVAQIYYSQIGREWRGTGLGQILYDKAIQLAKSKGYRYLNSDTHRSVDAEKAWKRLEKRYPVNDIEDEYGYVTNHQICIRPDLLNKVAEAVAIDNEKGIGRDYAIHGLVGSMGFRILMKPSTFLSLVAKMGNWAKPEYQAAMNDYLKAGNPIAAPTIRWVIPKEWEHGDYSKPAVVRGHEGRHRMTSILELDGDNLTEVIARISNDNKDIYSVSQIKPEWLRQINAQCVRQDDMLNSSYRITKGPFFKMSNPMFESKDKFTKKTDFRFKKGALLMQRLGPINAQKQNIIIRKPPVNRGMWAFPYPAFDIFFAYHKIEPLLPADLRRDNISAVYDKAKEEGRENDEDFAEMYQHLWDLREKASEKLKNKMRPKTFWWDGPLYSHIAPQGMQDDCKSWYLWTDLKAWAKAANKSMVTFDSYAAFGLKPNVAEKGFPTYSVDHLEVFLPEKAEITKQAKGRK
jgi:GNAT superfamily N-acetyltransferase